MLLILCVHDLYLYFSEEVPGNCLTGLKLQGKTGDLEFAGSSSPHKVQLTLNDGTNLQGTVCTSERNTSYLCTFSFKYGLEAGDKCVEIEDIEEVSLIANGDDGWYIASISTYVKTRYSDYILLTKNDDFNKWLDGDESFSYNAKKHVLTFAPFCLSELKIQGKTGDLPYAGSSSPHKIQLTLSNGTNLQGTVCPSVRNKPYLCTLSFKTELKAGDKCVQMENIEEVSLIANGNDGWYIASISTYVKTDRSRYILLTKNDDFNKWLDGDEEYPYNAKKHVLSFTEPSCLSELEIKGKTGDLTFAGSSSPHKIQLTLSNGTNLQGTVCPSVQNKPYLCTLSFKTGLKAGDKCVHMEDIHKVSLIANGNDGWYIASISTYVKTRYSHYMLLTKNDDFNKWLDDGDEKYPYNATKHVLTFAPSDNSVEKSDYSPSPVLSLPHDHEIQLVLKDGSMLQGVPYQSTRSGPYLCIGNDRSSQKCVKKSEIQSAALVATGNEDQD